MKHVYGYARASTLEQEDTLEVQLAQLKREWEYRWKEKGYLWAGCYTDAGISGNTPLRQRPLGVKMCALLQPGDVVIFTKLDRGFRNVRDLLNVMEWFDLRQVGAVIMDCAVDTKTAAGRMFITILGAFAEFERARIAERVREAAERRRQKGRPISGKPPYGYRYNGKPGKKYFVRDDYVRSVGAQIVDWVDRGWSIDNVYIHMLTLRMKTRKGKEWSRGAIQRAYIGEVQLRRQEAEIAEKTGLTPDSPESSVTPGESANGEPRSE